MKKLVQTFEKNGIYDYYLCFQLLMLNTYQLGCSRLLVVKWIGTKSYVFDYGLKHLVDPLKNLVNLLKKLVKSFEKIGIFFQNRRKW